MIRSDRRLLAPILITVVTVVAYGVLLPRLGFYRDDWYLFVTAQSEGIAGVIQLFQIDRPLIGYFYAFAYPLLDLSPLAWHAATLGLRILGNLCFWWLLTLIWPKRPLQNFAAALLFSVYPGYSVQPNAGVYSTDLAANAAVLLSIALTVKSIRSPSRAAWVLLSLVAMTLELLYLGLFESAIGMEVARLALVWYVVWRQNGPSLKAGILRAIKFDLPYLSMAAAFLVWRLFIFQSARRATNLDVLVGRYVTLPARSIFAVGIETLKDIFETVALAWSVPFYNFVASGNLRDLTVALALGLFVAAALILVLRGSPAPVLGAGEGPDDREYVHMIGLGVVMVVFALLPIDLAGRNVLFTDQWDRYTMYASSGVALLLGGALLRYVRASAVRVILAVLVGMSVVVHYFSAGWYRDFWTWQRDLWQQLSWRAPGLQPQTMLFVELPVGGYQEGYEIYGPANMIYFPGTALQLGADVINASTVTNLQLQKNRQHYDRTVLVEDNYRNALVMTYPTKLSCLHVLDGRKIELPGLVEDSLVAEAALYSHIERIDVTAAPAQLPAFLTGGPLRPWCRYYQGMDLARQAGDWAEVARLADEALSADLTPEDVSEWMPALEAYATLGRLPDARRAAAIIRSHDGARAYLCLQLQRGATYPEPYDYNLVRETLCQAN